MPLDLAAPMPQLYGAAITESNLHWWKEKTEREKKNKKLFGYLRGAPRLFSASASLDLDLDFLRFFEGVGETASAVLANA